MAGKCILLTASLIVSIIHIKTCLAWARSASAAAHLDIMFSICKLISLAFILISFVQCIVAGHGHVHRSHRHRHELRNIANKNKRSLAQAPSASSSIDSVVEDIAEIEQGANKLPKDLVNFLSTLDESLKEEEALLSKWINSLEPDLGVSTVDSSLYHSVSTSIDETPSTTIASLVTVAPSTTLVPMIASDPPLCQHPHSLCKGVSSIDTQEDASTSSSRHSDIISTSTASQSYSTITRTSTITRSLTVTYTTTRHTSSPRISAGPTSPSAFLNSTSTVLLSPSLSPSSNGSAHLSMPYGGFQTITTRTINSTPTPLPTYTFKPNRNSNVAVYYGQTPATTVVGLLTLCMNPNVDMVVLAFVTSFHEPDSPAASFGPGCTYGASSSQQAYAPGLRNCLALAPEIAACQQIGKPVLVSLGGYHANVTLSSDTEAEAVASQLWNLFGAGTANSTLRPFGTDVVVDGFDLDNESKNTTAYTAFTHALRNLFATDPSKRYYLSAAPQCPRPDASISLEVMALVDFVFVQFYNNPSCDLDAPGFQRSFADWSNDLAAVSNTTKVFIGAGAFEGAGSGYVVGAGLSSMVSLVREMEVENLGGVMLWDGSEALSNVDQYGEDYLVYAKGSLTT